MIAIASFVFGEKFLEFDLGGNSNSVYVQSLNTNFKLCKYHGNNLILFEHELSICPDPDNLIEVQCYSGSKSMFVDVNTNQITICNGGWVFAALKPENNSETHYSPLLSSESIDLHGYGSYILENVELPIGAIVTLDAEIFSSGLSSMNTNEFCKVLSSFESRTFMIESGTGYNYESLHYWRNRCNSNPLTVVTRALSDPRFEFGYYYDRYEEIPGDFEFLTRNSSRVINNKETCNVLSLSGLSQTATQILREQSAFSLLCIQDIFGVLTLLFPFEGARRDEYWYVNRIGLARWAKVAVGYNVSDILDPVASLCPYCLEDVVLREFLELAHVIRGFASFNEVFNAGSRYLHVKALLKDLNFGPDASEAVINQLTVDDVLNSLSMRPFNDLNDPVPTSNLSLANNAFYINNIVQASSALLISTRFQMTVMAFVEEIDLPYAQNLLLMWRNLTTVSRNIHFRYLLFPVKAESSIERLHSKLNIPSIDDSGYVSRLSMREISLTVINYIEKLSGKLDLVTVLIGLESMVSIDFGMMNDDMLKHRHYGIFPPVNYTKPKFEYELSYDLPNSLVFSAKSFIAHRNAMSIMTAGNNYMSKPDPLSSYFREATRLLSRSYPKLAASDGAGCDAIKAYGELLYSHYAVTNESYWMREFRPAISDLCDMNVYAFTGTSLAVLRYLHQVEKIARLQSSHNTDPFIFRSAFKTVAISSIAQGFSSLDIINRYFHFGRGGSSSWQYSILQFANANCSQIEKYLSYFQPIGMLSLPSRSRVFSEVWDTFQPILGSCLKMPPSYGAKDFIPAIGVELFTFEYLDGNLAVDLINGSISTFKNITEDYLESGCDSSSGLLTSFHLLEYIRDFPLQFKKDDRFDAQKIAYFFSYIGIIGFSQYSAFWFMYSFDPADYLTGERLTYMLISKLLNFDITKLNNEQRKQVLKTNLSQSSSLCELSFMNAFQNGYDILAVYFASQMYQTALGRLSVLPTMFQRVLPVPSYIDVIRSRVNMVAVMNMRDQFRKPGGMELYRDINTFYLTYGSNVTRMGDLLITANLISQVRITIVENEHFGFCSKISNIYDKLRELLNHGTMKNSDVVVFTDAYDVVYFPTARYLGRMFFKSARTPIVFCSESGLWPEVGAAWSYNRAFFGYHEDPEAGMGSDDNFYEFAKYRVLGAKFINSGCYIGRAEEVVKMLFAAMLMCPYISDDQQVLVRYGLSHPHLVSVDSCASNIDQSKAAIETGYVTASDGYFFRTAYRQLVQSEYYSMTLDYLVMETPEEVLVNPYQWYVLWKKHTLSQLRAVHPALDGDMCGKYTPFTIVHFNGFSNRMSSTVNMLASMQSLYNIFYQETDILIISLLIMDMMFEEAIIKLYSEKFASLDCHAKDQGTSLQRAACYFRTKLYVWLEYLGMLHLYQNISMVDTDGRTMVQSNIIDNIYTPEEMSSLRFQLCVGFEREKPV